MKNILIIMISATVFLGCGALKNLTPSKVEDVKPPVVVREIVKDTFYVSNTDTIFNHVVTSNTDTVLITKVIKVKGDTVKVEVEGRPMPKPVADTRIIDDRGITYYGIGFLIMALLNLVLGINKRAKK